MRRVLLGMAAIVVAGTAGAVHPAAPVEPVTVQNTPLPVTVQNASIPVSIADGTGAINTWRQVNERLVQPANGVPSVAVANVYANPSSTTAQLYAYVNTPSNEAYPCGSDPHPTSVEIDIFPIGQSAATGLLLPMSEHLAVRKGGADYCSAGVAAGPLFVPPGSQIDLRVVYTTLPGSITPVTFYVNVNGYYMK